MLLQMGIKNFALIEQLNQTFQEGITIFTGETGAGKSILMDAFSILLGERASNEFIRHGKDSFIIDGVFDISNMPALQKLLKEKNILVEEDNQLILSRSFTRQGKSLILANDQPIPLKALKEIGLYLADIHGQYSNQLLLDAHNHYLYLDTFNEGSKRAYQAYEIAYQSYKEAKKKYLDMMAQTSERAREIDMLRFQIDEIEEAGLRVAEDVEITAELQKLDNYETVTKVLTASYNALYEGRNPILDTLNTLQSEVKELVRFDKELAPIAESMSSAYYQVEEAGQSLDRYRDSISYDEERYMYCQQRDTLIYSLKKKYGSTIEDIFSFEEQAQKRLEELESITGSEEQLKEEVSILFKEAQKAWTELHSLREKNGAIICQKLQDNLKKLGMENANLKFIIKTGDELTSLGAESIELYFSANKGEVLLPLYKIASGGELARIALAFKSIFTEHSNKTLVFDEIDVGISGDIALQVAKQIQVLGQEGQVFCITHLPQTASVADHHYHLQKVEKDERTVSILKTLTQDEHITQIARMMSGDSFSETALKTAHEMVDFFKKFNYKIK